MSAVRLLRPGVVRAAPMLSPSNLFSRFMPQVHQGARCLSAVADKVDEADRFSRIRNIGISAHIDSGKTTLTERILFYTGRIDAIHEVRGKDNVGAKMDSMELERQKGITIQSAATYCSWGDNNINIIDTPGHVDFTIEVERALRVLDGAILVLCGVSGVQSQTLTVDRQMKRYNVPRVAFINKLDRQGANPHRVVEQIRSKLHMPAHVINIPIGLEDKLEGVIDLVTMKAHYFKGDDGENIVEEDIPANLLEEAERHRASMVETLADVDDDVAEAFFNDEMPSEEVIRAAIRQSTIGLKFVPVCCGSAFKNKGVQKLLDAVVEYLPNPTEVTNEAIEHVDNHEKKVILNGSTEDPLVALAFKLEDGKYGQLTYMRVYQGTLSKGGFLHNINTGKKVKVPRLVRMHSNEMEEINVAKSGEIVALFGVECASGDTFTDGSVKCTMTSMHVPDPVMSLAVQPKDKNNANFGKALNRFTKEDPTFRMEFDKESGQIIISGMGELHLEIYLERMKREYGVETISGQPQVNYRETVEAQSDFNHTHKKQSGGSGQFARVMGYVEPLEKDHEEDNVFENHTIGGSIPPEFIPACVKGFNEAMAKGSLIGHPVKHVRMVINDGAFHAVDSNELAFKTAARDAFRNAFQKARPTVLEPVMKVDIEVPMEFQGAVIGALNKRKGMITSTDTAMDYCYISADVPLANMFGYSTELRSLTQGKGEFSMEYADHQPVMPNVQEDLIKAYNKKQAEGKK